MTFTVSQALMLKEDNKRMPDVFTLIKRSPPTSIQKAVISNFPIRTWRSKTFLVQEFREKCGTIRLSVNRTTIKNDLSGWEEGITWDELMDIKRQCGYGEHCACELLPPDKQIVNVANMRHIFIMDTPPSFIWKKD